MSLDRVRVARGMAALVPTRCLSLLDGQPVADRAGGLDAAPSQHRDVSPDPARGRYRRSDPVFALVGSPQLRTRSGAVRGAVRGARVDRRAMGVSWRCARVCIHRAATSALLSALANAVARVRYATGHMAYCRWPRPQSIMGLTNSQRPGKEELCCFVTPRSYYLGW